MTEIICPNPRAHREQWRFRYQSGGFYYWERTLPNSNHVEQAVCNAAWFWSHR